MAANGEPLDAWRRCYAESLEALVRAEAAQLIPSLGGLHLQYRRGWAVGESLAQALGRARDRDRQRGHTGIGPHRADWRIAFDAAERHDQLSRGQEKLVALACVLAQAAHFAQQHGEWPVICLDDLASELDREHQQRLVRRLLDTGAQVWVTGTEAPAALDGCIAQVFHVEHGQVRPVA